MNRFPFTEAKVSRNVVLREFAADIDKRDLVWHRDREDRYITVLEGRDWRLQLDNRLPQRLREGHTYYVPRGMWHRVIKGRGELVVEIVKDNSGRRLVEADEYDDELTPRDEALEAYSDAYKYAFGIRPRNLVWNRLEALSTEEIYEEIDNLYTYGEDQIAQKTEVLPDDPLGDMEQDEYIDPWADVPLRSGMGRRAK